MSLSLDCCEESCCAAYPIASAKTSISGSRSVIILSLDRVPGLGISFPIQLLLMARDILGAWNRSATNFCFQRTTLLTVYFSGTMDTKAKYFWNVPFLWSTWNKIRFGSQEKMWK